MGKSAKNFDKRKCHLLARKNYALCYNEGLEESENFPQSRRYRPRRSNKLTRSEKSLPPDVARVVDNALISDRL
jgi:hypothetical protein